MGLSLFRNCGTNPAARAPNPSVFRINHIEEIKPGVCVVKATYPGCTNYEGVKILVVRGTQERVEQMLVLDPHFTKGGPIVARFEPTDIGWYMAILSAQTTPT